MTLLNPPLSVRGASITDAAGNPVKLCGVNWPGAHQDGLVPAGLDKLHRDAIAARIKSWGLNHVRLTFAVGTIMNKDGSMRTGLADNARLAANPDLRGLTPWDVYQAVADSLTAAGLAVIPNCHLMYPGWCCSEADGQGLWWNGNWPASVFASAWQVVAQRFAGNELIIGYDLKNEPRKATTGGVTYVPTWGDGNPKTDFQLMYSQVGAKVQAADPDALVFCEGLSYASDLTAAGQHLVTLPHPGKVVYSVHDYSWFHPDGQSQADYVTQMDQRAGYLVTGGKAPLWVGEFGADNGSRAAFESGWLANFRAWATARGVSWCWWNLSAQKVKGTEPVTNVLKASDGDRESFGLMAGHDWAGTSSETIAAALQPLL